MDSQNFVDDLPEDFAAAWATVLLDIWQKQQPKPLTEKPRDGEEGAGHVH
jgi:hypothetical protein